MDEAEAAEITARLRAAESRGELLASQLTALAEAAQQIKSERGVALAGLAAATARAEEATAAMEAAQAVAAAAAASETEHVAAVDDARAQVRLLGDSLAWLEACTRDAATDARPRLRP